jgi:WD40 repeat protein
MARIFISHSSQDNAEALALRDWLISQGWTDLFLDIDPNKGLVAADRWQKALRLSIGRCKAVIFCISPAWLNSQHCISEFNEAMHIDAAPIGVVIKPLQGGSIPGEMTSVWQITDLTRGGKPVPFTVAPPPERTSVTVQYPAEELQRLRAGLAKLGLVGFETQSFAWPPPDDANRAPYRGLEPLDLQDAGVFFGRDSDLVRAREEMLDLRARGGGQLFIILGASGAGKSSFLRAGLLPRLAREDRDFLVLPVIRPAGAPLSGETGLARSLQGALATQDAQRPLGEIRQDLGAGGDAILPLLAEIQSRAVASQVGEGVHQIDQPPTPILSVDQAEEMFSPDHNDESEAFLQLLAAAVSRGPGVIILLTIRADRYELLQTSPLLQAIPKWAFDLPPNNAFAFREAILGPAERADPKIAFEPRLVDRLIAETAQQGADPLPLLAFTLERLYEDFGRTTHELTVDNYTAIGGVQGAIEAALAVAFAEPERSPAIPSDRTAREALIAQTFIPALVDVAEATNTPLRRIAPESDIASEGRALVARLVEKRLLVRGSRKLPDSGGEETTIEVAHEALLRQWPLLRDALTGQTEAIKTVQAAERATQEWLGNNRGEDWLNLWGERLAAVEALAARRQFARRLSGVTGTYIATCRSHQDQWNEHKKARERSKRRLWRAIAIVSMASVVGLAWSYWQLKMSSDLNQKILATQRAALDSTRETQNPTLAAKLALAAWPRRPNDALPATELTGTLLGQVVPQMRKQIVLEGHTGFVKKVAFALDGKHVVTASQDGSARVWDAESGRQISPPLRVGKPALPISSVSFSPVDANRVLTTSNETQAYVWDAETGRTLLTLKGHTKPVRSAAFSPDGKRILTASDDDTARIWDGETGTSIATLSGHEKPIVSAVFSPDGTRILTASDDNTARIWDAQTGQSLHVLAGHKSGVWNAAFSNDGARIVTVSGDKIVRVWNAATGELVSAIRGHSAAVYRAMLSPDAKLVVTASGDGTACIWNAETGERIQTLIGHGGDVWNATFSTEGRRIVTASSDNTARIWNVDTGQQVAIFRHTGPVTDAEFSPDGQSIATASWDNTARIWPTGKDTDVEVLAAPEGADREAEVKIAAFSAENDSHVVTISGDGATHLWDARTAKEISILPQSGQGLTIAALSPGEDRVITITEQGTAQLRDAGTGTIVRALAEGAGRVNSAAFSKDGTRIVTTSEDATARIWDAGSGRPVSPAMVHSSAVYGAVFSPNGKRIVTASVDGAIQVWDADAGKPVSLPIMHASAVNTAVLSRDGSLLVTTTQDNIARIWDVANSAVLHSLIGHEAQIRSALFSPDDRFVVTASQDKTARIWEAASGIEISVLKGHTGWVLSAAFSTDGKRVVTASQDKTARVWDVQTGQEILDLTGHGTTVLSAVFSKDGQRILTASADGTARIWNISTLPKGNIFDIACALLPDKKLEGAVIRDLDPALKKDPICAEGQRPPIPTLPWANDVVEVKDPHSLDPVP